MNDALYNNFIQPKLLKWLRSSDFRLLQAVNVPELYHLAEVLVFPTEGLRPHPNEISGK